ncbi:MAG TPA: trehalose-6-phosphate synthase, partial [Alphaproteobacteria bacterium]|nr:trehalose-6-phosphate synthase [Alphaproteobacteria bacterium]
ATIDLEPQDIDEYYNGYANRTLWPLFHYRIDLTAYDRRFDKGYFRVNARFAHGLAPQLQPDDLIWVHDYHLIACAEELRRMGCEQRIGFFLHIPFPAPQVLLTLPNHQALVRALFAYDLIGFQTESDLRALRDYVVYEALGKLLPDGRLAAFGRTIQAAVFPIGIDAEEMTTMTETGEARRHYDRMRRSMADRKLIIGVDRLDYTKGLPERLAAFARLLDTYPDNHGHVTFLQIAPSSRPDVKDYVDIREELEGAAGRINGQHADFDWMPVRYVNRSYARRSLAGLYRAADVALVTPLRDGMNLVAKEYVACQNPDDPGVLVLSQFAGAARQLDDALIVNPYDADDLVEGLQRALHMPLDERKRRWETMMHNVSNEDVAAWRDDFVRALRAVPTTESP